VAYLSSFASSAAIAIENARLHEEVTRHATILEARVRERTSELAYMNLDLTAALRQAEAGNQAKNDFLLNMSHELRTPLNAVLGFAQLLQEQAKEGLTAKQRRYLDNIYTSGHHLLSLVNEILDLDAVEAGRLTLDRTTVNVAEVIADALDATREAMRQKNHAIHVLIPPDLPAVSADPVRIRQIVGNLLTNAVKFTPDGGTITVQACTVPAEEQGSRGAEEPGAPQPPSPAALLRFFEIAVIDTGIGLRAEELPRLFQTFTQLESPIVKSHGGTGVGLALTKKLVELHGGTIMAASPGAGQGSTFTVRLPMGDPDATIPATTAGTGEERRAGTSTTDET
jgi:signal transduction histidine kinase